MAIFRKIKSFSLNPSSVWSLVWSNLGNFLISCNSDGKYFLWGKRSSMILGYSKKKIEIEKKIFQKWNCLEFSQNKKRKTTIRACDYSFNFYEISMCSFEGIFFTTKIFFSRSDGVFFTNESPSFFFGKSEIKACEFSPDSLYFAASTRNKNLWVWKKKLSNSYEPFFIFGNHESDVKQTRWHPYFGFIITSTYEGVVRVINKKNKEMLLNSSIRFSSFCILGLNISESGDKVILCTGKGEIICIPFYKNFFSQPKKKIKGGLLFFSFTRNTIQCQALSKINSVLSFSGDDDSLQILKVTKIWSINRNKKLFYKSSKKDSILEIQSSISRAHCGFINCVAWHPRYNNLFASCGDDAVVSIWIMV